MTIRSDFYQNRLGTKSVGADYVIEGTAKAWANLNGTGTIALRDSFNVSSVTDNGVGDYTFNFTNAMSTGDYSVSMASRQFVGNAAITFAEDAGDVKTSTYWTVCVLQTSTRLDTDHATSAIHGDLA